MAEEEAAPSAQHPYVKHEEGRSQLSIRALQISQKLSNQWNLESRKRQLKIASKFTAFLSVFPAWCSSPHSQTGTHPRLQ